MKRTLTLLLSGAMGLILAGCGTSASSVGHNPSHAMEKQNEGARIMATNLEIIKATYEGASEENGKNLLAVLAPDVSWTEAAGFPYAGTYIGPQAVIENVFKRLGTEWIGYKATANTYLVDGDRVAVFGVYSGTYKKTNKAMSATFAHLYRLKDGKIITMEQYVDSAIVQKAMSGL